SRHLRASFRGWPFLILSSFNERAGLFITLRHAFPRSGVEEHQAVEPLGVAKKKRRPGENQDASFASGGGGNLVRFRLLLRLRLEVVFAVINVLRRRILFMVDLLLFRSRQRSAVSLAVRGNLPVDALLLLLGLGRFSPLGRCDPADFLCAAPRWAWALLPAWVRPLVLPPSRSFRSALRRAPAHPDLRPAPRFRPSAPERARHSTSCR